jgi:hypothetical protein
MTPYTFFFRLPRSILWLLAGFGLVSGIVDYLHTQLEATGNYSVTANVHNSLITTAPAKPFSSPLFLHQPFPGSGF